MTKNKILKNRYKKGRHAELVSASSTQIVSEQQQQALKTLKQVQGDLVITKANAFTLVELLVVVLIIGILAAVAVPQYQKAVDKASFSCIMTILTSVTEAQTVAAMEQGGYPASGHYFTFNDLNITLPVENQNCLETDNCAIKCSGKGYNIILRNTSTWANFYFWASSLERLTYTNGATLPWQLQCTSARCKELAKSFGATDCTGGLCW